MPGIVGIISRQKSPDECQRLVASMMRSMMHESFYVSGMQAFGELGIYAGWVAHASSLSAGQVFWNEQKDIALFFAGECFIDATSRTELERAGHDLGTVAGGWLVHLYEEKGEEFFELLNGLFSGLLIDKRNGRTFLFNDRYGIERLYWYERPDATYFASEAKALLRVLPESRAFDEEGVAQFLAFGCTLNWKTLFRNVHLAPGGTLWSIENGICRRGRYFTPAKWEEQPLLSEEAFEAGLEETFKRILPRYFESDSRVGISLTGGLDTRMIMACLPKCDSKPVCYTFAGANGETRDAQIARLVAKACELEHEVLRIGPNFFAEFRSYADRTVYNTDGCFGVLGTHEIYFNAQARRRSATRLTGGFGSEILRGLSTFKPIGFSPELVNPELRKTLDLIAPSQAWSEYHSVTFAAFLEIPWNIYGSLMACRSQVTFRTPYLDNEIVALAYQAPVSLRRSALTAANFVKRNNPTLAGILTDRGFLGDGAGVGRAVGRLLAEVTFKLDYLQNEGLPQMLSRSDTLIKNLNIKLKVLGQHKYLYYRRWFRNELAAYLREMVAEEDAQCSPIWDQEEVRRLVREHITGAKNRLLDVGAVLSLQTVERLLIRGETGLA